MKGPGGRGLLVYLFVVALLDLSVLLRRVRIDFGRGEREDVEKRSGHSAKNGTSPVDLE